MITNFTKKPRRLSRLHQESKQRLLKGTGLAFFAFLMITFSSFAQEKHQLTGTITAEIDESPVPGASIFIKGTTIGTTSDADGKFSIDVAESDVIVISYIGFVTEEIPVGAKTLVNISLMEDISTLSEVVVVGYGEMKKSNITGAQTSIKAEDIQRTVNTTVEQAIQGRSAGVYITQNSGQPGGGISVNIRGINTIGGSNEPLYVIDGVQMQQSSNVNYGSASSSNPLASLNPNDIENIEILQGPSATAIYGSRGTNGVVLITTKRGKAGQTKVSYGYMYSLQDKPKPLETMTLPQFAAMYTDIRSATGGTVPTEFTNPSLLGPGTNWQNELFKTAPMQKHALSLSGGTDKTQYFLSGEHLDQDGIALGSGFKRASIRLNVDNQVRKWLKIGANLNFSQTDEQLSATQEGVINNALRLAPNIPVRNPDGTWGGADAINGSSVQHTPLNPVAIASLIENDLRRRKFLGGLNADVTLLKGLVFTTSFSTDINDSRQDVFTPSYRLGDKINDQATLSVNTGNSAYWNWNQLLRYNVKFGKHDIGLMVSHEAQESKGENLSGSKTGFATNSIPDLNIGNTQGQTTNGGHYQWAMESYFGRANYSFNDKYILQGAIRADGSVNFGPENRWGVFPSVSGAWRVSQEPFFKENVSFINEFKIRAETGVTGNQGSGTNQYSPLASVATPWGSGFNASRYGNPNLKWEETKTHNIGFNINFFQNRIQLEGDFYIKNTENLLLSSPLPDYFGTSGEGGIAPPVVNIGAMENRGWAFSLNTTNYDRGGFKWNSNFNISGFEAKVTKFYSETAFVDRKPWYVGDTGSGNNWAQRASVGQAPWLFQGYIYEGIFQTVEEVENSPRPADNNGVPLVASPETIWVGDVKFKDLNGDGIIDDRDRTNIGNPWPKFNAGFTNTFSYKGFDLSILLTAVYGNDVYNLLRFNNTNPNGINVGQNMLAETFDYAKIEGDGADAHLTNPGTDIPRLSVSNQNGNRLRFTDQYVEDGSYIRIKNINLGYNIPKTLFGNQNVIEGIRVSAGVQNIYTFTKYKGYDPEVGAYVGQNSGAGDQAIGLDYGRYPLTPVYTFSVGLDF